MAQFDLGLSKQEEDLERTLDGLYIAAEMEFSKSAGDLNDVQLKTLHYLSTELTKACEKVIIERSEGN